MQNYDIVVIDSGVDENVEGICIGLKNEELVFSKDISDAMGHGTIIYSIIKKQCPDKKIYVVKLNSMDDVAGAGLIIAALKYIFENISCRVINISLGVKILEEYEDLYEICNRLSKKGTIIVSAFDNEGCISYPAAFDCVIGVDNKKEIKSISDYEYVENSPVNIFAKGSMQIVKFKNGKTFLTAGSSVSCAHITGVIASTEQMPNDMDNALSFLRKNAKKILICPTKKTDNRKGLFKINKAIVFPFSKEIHAFVRFSDMLTFEIIGYYDIRESGKVGRKLSKYSDNPEIDGEIMDIEKAVFDEADTIILGHLDELVSLTQYDYKRKLVDIAIQQGLNIYSFDSLNEYHSELIRAGCDVYYPEVNLDETLWNSFGKLYKISKPVVGIFGTSSSQGKFSLQVAMKRELEEKKYNVGVVGTEPHSPLFGFDEVFPTGYNSHVNMQNHEVVLYLNRVIDGLCKSDKDIIISSSQSQTIPYYGNNILEYSSIQYYFALGINPDAIILCINYYDELQYIKNTIYTLEGLTDSNIIAIVINPMTYKTEWSAAKQPITPEDFLEKKEILNECFDIPVYFPNKESYRDICEAIIDYF